MAAPVAPPLVRAPPRIPAPTRPQPPDPQRFPLVATIAPVLMSLAIYFVTSSPFALLFAGLGPLMAIGSLVDGRLVRRRRTRTEVARFEAELAAAQREISDAHGVERRILEDGTPSAIGLATARGREAVRWRSHDPREPVVRLGTGEVPSAVTLEGASGIRGEDHAALRLRELRAETAVIPDGPVVVEARSGVGIIGPLVVADALARSLVLQLGAELSPARWTLQAATDSWLQGGPHRVATGTDRVATFVSPAQGEILVAVAATAQELPAHLGTVIAVSGARATVIRSAGPLPTTFTPELLSLELALGWAATAGALAVADGLVPATGGIPDAVTFAELVEEQQASSEQPGAVPQPGLRSAIGRGAGGVEVLDLVSEGPHAIVGGTTGSGKSELLVSWLLAMAREHSPASVGFLLFDFKGGSSFGEITGLPHVVGLVTDLDAAGAARAMASLGAELRHRERVIAEARVRSIDELPTSMGLSPSMGLSRLVVVVDEFAALAADFPELNAQFGDIAARGRSLGIHLVLSTQRPVGVIRDAVLANTALRVSLRVNNRPDSTAVIGADDAATTGTPPGRAWISRDGSPPVAVQVAMATSLDVATVVTAWSGHPAPRRPWLDPLPERLDPSSLPIGAFGLLDRPAQQRQDPALWTPLDHGNVLVIGAGRSGKSTALAALVAGTAGPDAVVVPPDVEGAWDALTSLAAEPEPRTVLIDDLDALIVSFGPDYERSVIDLVTTLLRGSGTARHRMAIATQRLSAPLHQLAALCDSRLLLRLSNRQEHLLAGGSAETFVSDLAPGAGHWRGERVQVAAVPPLVTAARGSAASLAPRGLVLAVSSRPAAFADRCAAAGIRCLELGGPAEGSALRYADAATPLVLVASSDGWQAHWNGLSALRAQYPLLIEGGSIAEFRSMSRLRQLPPPLADGSASGWLVDPSGLVSRVALP